MKAYLFINPSSGSHSDVRKRFVMAQLHSHSIIPEVFQVRTPAEISVYCDTLNKKREPHLIIVAGGDGTFNAVVNGLTPGTATLAVLPFGTSNVLAAEIGITSIEDGITRIAAGHTQPLSLGLLEMETRALRFVLMAGIGLDGAIVRDVWPMAKHFLRQGAYALSALKQAAQWDTTTFTLHSKQGEIFCHTAIICNASRYGGNFTLSPECSPFSQGMSAVCITGKSRSTYLGSALDLFRNRADKNKHLVRINSPNFEILGEQPIQIDGDFVGYGPARISECPDFARIIV
jgi:diacylglycerol kinase family enzyme